MHTHSGTTWHPNGTELEELWFPHVEYVAGGTENDLTLLITGTPKARHGEDVGLQTYLLSFRDVQAVEGYSETVYWMLAEEAERPGSNFSTIVNSRLLQMIEPFRGNGFRHFLLCGGNMCCEVLASEDYRLRRFETEAEARCVASREAAQ